MPRRTAIVSTDRPNGRFTVDELRAALDGLPGNHEIKGRVRWGGWLTRIETRESRRPVTAGYSSTDRTPADLGTPPAGPAPGAPRTSPSNGSTGRRRSGRD